MEKFITYDIFKYEILAQALSNKNRLKILNLLKDGPLNIHDISKELKMPMPTVTVNIQKLEESGLITCMSKAGKHGKQKICSLKYEELTLKFFHNEIKDEEHVNSTEPIIDINHESLSQSPIKNNSLLEKNIDIKIGSFTEYNVKPESGIASLKEIVDNANGVALSSSPEKMDCEVLWFNDGYVAYDVPLSLDSYTLDSIKISFEVCSEHMFFGNNWASDISLWLNDYEIGTYTSEGYFGSKGILTPNWWPLDKPQHGEYVSFEVNTNGTYINGNIIQSFTIKELTNIQDSFQIKIGIKEDAKNARGIMIFGEHFGNYKQSIKIQAQLATYSER